MSSICSFRVSSLIQPRPPCPVEESNCLPGKTAPPCLPSRRSPLRRESQSGRRRRTSPFGRVGSRPQDSVVGLRHQGAILLRLRPRLLPVGVPLERRPALFPLSQVGVAQH